MARVYSSVIRSAFQLWMDYTVTDNPLSTVVTINNIGIKQQTNGEYNSKVSSYKYYLSNGKNIQTPWSIYKGSEILISGKSQPYLGDLIIGESVYYIDTYNSSNRVSFTVPKTAEPQSVTFKTVFSGKWERDYHKPSEQKFGYNAQYTDTVTASATITVPALASRTIVFDANGGDNAPESQTELINTDIIITNDIPTRAGYVFKGWGMTQTATAASYQPGGNYTALNGATLYAVWAYGYGVSLSSITAKRWNDTKAGGENDEGKYGFITGSYVLTGALQNTGTLSAKYKKTSDTSWKEVPTSVITPLTSTKAESDASKVVSFEIGPFGGDIDTDSTYNIQVSVTDSDGNVFTLEDYISTAFFTIDFKKGGKEVAFGTPANDDDIPQNGRFKCGMEAVFVNSSLAFKNIFNLFYPVGSVYETSLPNAIPSGEATPTAEDLANLGVTWFDPQYQWGGTWELVQDRFLVGAGNLYAVDAEGGSKDAVVVSHHHTTNTYHRHTLSGVKYGSNYCAAGGRSGVGANSDAKTTLYTTYAGSQTAESTTVGEDGTDKNMPPYKAVYIWHRTA